MLASAHEHNLVLFLKVYLLILNPSFNTSGMQLFKTCRSGKSLSDRIIKQKSPDFFKSGLFRFIINFKIQRLKLIRHRDKDLKFRQVH